MNKNPLAINSEFCVLIEPDVPPRDLLSMVVAILNVQTNQSRWLDDLYSRGIEIAEPIGGHWTLLNLALDAIGVPRENMPDGCTEDDWIDGVHFCRDRCTAIFDLMCVRHDDVSGFIEFASNKDHWLWSSEIDDDALEAKMYG